MKSDLTTWQMLHTTPERAINEALQEQAESLNKDTWLSVVEDEATALTGNLFHPSSLWVAFSLNDNMEVLRGFPHVAIFPRSEESRKRWEAQGIGKVLSVIPDPLILVDSVLNLNNR